jgi:cystathionine beta-lyase/cystathionine gamma-synthase
MEHGHSEVSGGSSSITVADIDLDHEALEKERKEAMAQVVLVNDLAKHYDRDRGSFLKLLKRNGIKIMKVRDGVSGQQQNCVTIEATKFIETIMTPEHEVVDVESVLNAPETTD